MGELIIDNPYTGEQICRRPLADEATVEAKLQAATKAAHRLAALGVARRRELCQAAVAAMRADEQRIAADITAMVGKPLRQSRAELATMIARAEHLMDIAEASLAERRLPDKTGYRRSIQRVPLGVVFNMPAWNYPLLTCVNALWPAVLAGNAVLLKHSSRSALCGEHFAQAFESAGAPAGVVQALHCDHPTAARIAQDSRIGYVAFTGSVSGGRAVYRAVGATRFIDVGLELGGKDAAYVAADAELARTIEGLVDGACYNAGQSCCAVERVYVHRSLHDELLEGLGRKMTALTLGAPTTAVDMGPMAQPGAPDNLHAQVQQATARGAALHCGGEPTSDEGRGRFFQPTLLSAVDHQMDVMRTESFGPLLPVMAVDSDEQAAELINDSALGLTASVWTSDPERAARIAAQLGVGTVYMNQCDVLDPALPWTGVKDSGKGSTLSAIGFAHLTRPRAINFRL